jgi:hypothetical protein
MGFRQAWFIGNITDMNYEYFQKLLNARPFQPFAVQLSSGVVHAVRYPGCANLTRTRMVVTDPDADDIVVISLLHVVKVDMLSTGEPAAPISPAS